MQKAQKDQALAYCLLIQKMLRDLDEVRRSPCSFRSQTPPNTPPARPQPVICSQDSLTSTSQQGAGKSLAAEAPPQCSFLWAVILGMGTGCLSGGGAAKGLEAEGHEAEGASMP